MKKMQRKKVIDKRGISTTFAAGIIIAIITIAAVGVVSYYSFGMPASEAKEKVSSLQFTTEPMPDVSGTTTGAMTGYLKDIGTDNLKLRMEVTLEGEAFMKLIANGQQNKAWIWSVFSNSWMDISNDFEKQWTNAKMLVDQVLLGLSKGTLEEFDYTDPTTNEIQTFKIAEYQVNPTIADSLFEVDTTYVAEGYASIKIWGDYADRTNERVITVYGNAENTGTKSAQNCRLEIAVVFEIDNITQIKTEFVTLGDIPSGTVREFIATIQLPIGVNTAMTSYNISVWHD